MVGVIASAVVIAAEVLGRNGMLWAYCVLLASFFLVDRRIALGTNVLVVATIALLSGSFPEGSERVSFAVTAGLVSLYAFIFATRTELQRRQLESLASHDPLTAAGNRRLMESELEEAVRQFERRPRPTVLAVIDLDLFKIINDTHGHEAGDRVLANFAAIVRGRLRKLDRLYRLGGEEFVLLLPSTPLNALPGVLERLQEALRAELRSPGGPVTVSIGAAALHADERWNEWLARADAALYRAKNAGRDRFEIDRDPEAHTGSVEVLAERRSRLG
jgi:diguanylate cyclase (GGDEF)-like protein